eukprot:15085490-Alexandrium_andersonii.AAC.1
MRGLAKQSGVRPNPYDLSTVRRASTWVDETKARLGLDWTGGIVPPAVAVDRTERVQGRRS